MDQLNFRPFKAILKNRENKRYILDPVRKKEVVLTPEEWVRQHCIQFLLHEKSYPLALINVEKKIDLFGITKRYDIVVFNPSGELDILVECKAPSVKITQTTFDQIARYNLQLKSNYLMVTNGLSHIYCQMDYQNKRYHFLPKLPNYTRQ